MKRILTAAVLVPITVWTVLYSPWAAFVAIVALIACLCFREYASMTGTFAPLGMVAGLLILVAPPTETILVLFLSTLAALSLPLFADGELEEGLRKSASLVLGILYVFGGWKTAILVHDLDRPRVGSGHQLLMFGLLVNWAGDTGAYYVGRRFGRVKLAPRVSPGKTREGSAASIVSSMVFGVLYLPWAVPGVPIWKAALIALAANIAGQTGDLAESAIKRVCGVKDSGKLLPGHGGMLDRVDSTLFSMPVVYTLLGLLERA
jgi:phosphatidate cytidylyltransferase